MRLRATTGSLAGHDWTTVGLERVCGFRETAH